MNRLSAFLLLFTIACSTPPETETNTNLPGLDWPEFQGGPDRSQYSPADQITRENVTKLEKVWEYHTDDEGQIQCNPLVINGVLYGMTPAVQPFAIRADNGSEIWKADSGDEENFLSTSRGLVYWAEGPDKRILYTNQSWLMARNAETGELISSFGDNGRTSLKAGLGAAAGDKFVISNTPGTVFEDLIVMPLRVSEGPDAAPGYIQAFNIRTGKLAWVFHTIPHPGEDGYGTWPPDIYRNESGVGAANNWAGMAVDRERGIIYVPTGSAAFDFYGGNRPGQNLYANTLLALDARTGKKIWHYQMVHHDILDRDPPSAPNLLTIRRNGEDIDAVAQITKQGYVFLFDRETGQPLFEIEEVPVPPSDIPGESAWPTQPWPTLPAPFARQDLTEQDISTIASNREELLELFRNSRYEGPFTPLSLKGSIIFPGLDGGGEWGGAATDPSGVIYINSNEMAWHIRLMENNPELAEGMTTGEGIYAINCSSCHGKDRKGNEASGFPSLADLSDRLDREAVSSLIKSGKGMMPAFPQLSDEQHQALLDYLYNKQISKEPGLDFTEAAPAAYRISGYTKFLDADGFPAIEPPWGTLNAIDLNTGEYKWKIPFGQYPELAERGMSNTGAESYGGPVVTAGGLLFIAGTKDKRFRAYDKENGQLLWETVLPAPGFATPSVYVVNGKQYIVIACGGDKLGAGKGDSYLAFALPEAN